MAKILVSECLLGVECRYKGDGCACLPLLELAKEHTLVPVCPEQLGGLPTPRPPAERIGDRVATKRGRDVTAQYQKGAREAVRVAEINGVDFAIMKAKSPSCGKGLIYDGTFTGGKREGNGVAVELLLESGIEVYSDEEPETWPVG